MSHSLRISASAVILVVASAAVADAQCGACSTGGDDASSECSHHSAATGTADESCNHAGHSSGGQAVGSAGWLQQPSRPMPHDGQLATSAQHRFEVVYTPKQVRVFVYSPAMQRLDTDHVRGEAAMRVNGNPQVFRYSLEHASDGPGMSYLSVPVELSQIRDGDMLVWFRMENLPLRDEPQAEFTQLFSMTEPKRGVHSGPHRAPASSTVRVLPLGEADRPLIERQRICPVRGTVLGQHGAPVKLEVHGQPMFVCCQGCVDSVQKSPELYVPAPAASQPSLSPPIPEAIVAMSDGSGSQTAASPRPSFQVMDATAADAAAIQKQDVCPVLHSKLGEHGTPVKILIDGQPIFVCCRGCVEQVRKNPALYAARTAEPAGGLHG